MNPLAMTLVLVTFDEDTEDPTTEAFLFDTQDEAWAWVNHNEPKLQSRKARYLITKLSDPANIDAI